MRAKNGSFILIPYDISTWFKWHGYRINRYYYYKTVAVLVHRDTTTPTQLQTYIHPFIIKIY